MRIIAVLFASAVLVAATAPARADATAKQFLELDASDDGVLLAETKIASMEEGIRAVNASLRGVDAQLYCQPPTLVLTGSQLADMVRRAVTANDKLKDQAMSAVLLDTLRKTFPCAAAAH